jgi:hypothetical protein
MISRLLFVSESTFSSVAVAAMRSGYFKRLAQFGTGAVVLLVFQCVCAPGLARAGCNHLVASRTDPGQLPSLIEPLMDELGRRTVPFQAPPLPCTGAWCSGQPPTPAVPAGVYDWDMESWAWWTSDQCPVATPSSFTSPSSTALHLLHHGSAVFHPPRLLPSAQKPIIVRAQSPSASGVAEGWRTVPPCCQTMSAHGLSSHAASGRPSCKCRCLPETFRVRPFGIEPFNILYRILRFAGHDLMT